MSNFLNLKRDINIFKQFWHQIRDKSPITASFLRIIFVIFKWVIILVIILILINVIISTLILFFSTSFQRKCNFTIEKIETSFSEEKCPRSSKKVYGIDWTKYKCDRSGAKEGDLMSVSWNYSGLIKNKSNRKEYLEKVEGKTYNEQGILIGSGTYKIGKFIEGGETLPFELKVTVSNFGDGAEWRWYIESKNFKPYIYPIFKTCK